VQIEIKKKRGQKRSKHFFLASTELILDLSNEIGRSIMFSQGLLTLVNNSQKNFPLAVENFFFEKKSWKKEYPYDFVDSKKSENRDFWLKMMFFWMTIVRWFWKKFEKVAKKFFFEVLGHKFEVSKIDKMIKKYQKVQKHPLNSWQKTFTIHDHDMITCSSWKVIIISSRNKCFAQK